MEKKAKKKKIKYEKYLGFLFLLAVFLFLFSLIMFLSGFSNLQTQIFYASVNVTIGRIGFDVNGTALTFGNVARPGSSTRSIIFENGYSSSVLVVIDSNGSIKPILDFDKFVKIGEGETKKIPFTVVVSPEVEEGFYEGFVRFRIKARF